MAEQEGAGLPAGQLADKGARSRTLILKCCLHLNVFCAPVEIRVEHGFETRNGRSLQAELRPLKTDASLHFASVTQRPPRRPRRLRRLGCCCRTDEK